MSSSSFTSGRSLTDAVALFSNGRASYAVAVPERSGEGLIQVARVIPGGLHWSYRQLFDIAERSEDAAMFSQYSANLGIVMALESKGKSLAVVDAYLAPVQLRSFPQVGNKRETKETLRAPRSLWRSLSRQLSSIDGAYAGEAQKLLRTTADTYAAQLIGERDAAAPYLVGSSFYPEYSQQASLPFMQDFLRRAPMPAAASRVATIQLARAIEQQPLIEREGIVDLVAHLNERYSRSHRRRIA